jgi:altronate hydrolase
MLVEIANPQDRARSALQIHPSDNVAVALVAIPAGFDLLVSGLPVRTADPIPAGHKLALWDIAAGEIVERYGQPIGRATEAIPAGRHVHTHNLAFEDLVRDYEFPAGELPFPKPPADAPSFPGYLRADGRVGTRNYIAIVAASNCSAHAATLIARSFEGEQLPPGVDGVVAFPHGDGCGHAMGPDTVLLRRTFAGILDHPNVSAALIVGLGCEDNQIAGYFGASTDRSRLAGLTLQESGGTRATLEAARRDVRRFIEQAAEERRVPCPTSKLVVGLNCGGSDSFSGITANPALGHCSDLLAAAGGTSVLAETPEIFGAEHLLVRRARDRATAEKLLDCVRRFGEYLGRFDRGFDDNPSPGNKEGGLTNILEKSLGATAKGGTGTLMAVYDYAERIAAAGLCFMHTPGYDPVSLAGLAAGGCNLIAFTTGRGSAIGFPTVPVLKIASNSRIFRRMRDNMDIDAGAIADGQATVESTGREIFQAILEIAAGRPTAAEIQGHHEFVPWRTGPTV